MRKRCLPRSNQSPTGAVDARFMTRNAPGSAGEAAPLVMVLPVHFRLPALQEPRGDQERRGEAALLGGGTLLLPLAVVTEQEQPRRGAAAAVANELPVLCSLETAPAKVGISFLPCFERLAVGEKI